MRKLVFTFVLPVLGMILNSCASEQPAATTTTTTTTTTQQQVTPPASEFTRTGMMRGM